MGIRYLVVCFSISLLIPIKAQAVSRTWQGQSPPSWGSALNWTPIGLPQPNDDIGIGDAQHEDVESELNTDYTITNLDLDSGADVDTNGHHLIVDGTVNLNNFFGDPFTTTRLIVRENAIGPAATSLTAETIDVRAGTELVLDGGKLVLSKPGTDGGFLSVIQSGAVFSGYGVMRFQDDLSSATAQMSIGSDVVFQTMRPAGAPATERFVLRIESSDPVDSRTDFWINNNTVNIAAMTTLDVDTFFSGIFSASLNMAPGSILDTSNSTGPTNLRILDQGTINVNAASATVGVDDTAIVRGPHLEFDPEANLNINSGTLIAEEGLTTAASSVIDVGMNAGLQVDDTSTIDGDINFNSTGTSLVVNGILDINDPVFDWDGSEDGVTTVNAGGDLNISTTNLESGAGDASFDGTINLDEGSIQTFIPSGWTMAGDLNFTNGGDYFASSGTITVTGNVHVSGGTSQMTSSVVFADGSTTTIQDATDVFRINGEKTVEAGAQFTGDGLLQNSTNGDLTLADGANVQVPFLNAAGLTGILADLFIEDGIGQAQVLTFDQTSRGQLFIEIASGSQHDQLNVDLTAFIDGMLQVELLGAFNPAVGDAFTILTTGTGVFGKFDNSESSLPELLGGRKWFIDYGDNDVTLRVLYSADADNDGDVDGADFLRLQRRNPSLIAAWQSQYGLSIPAFATTQAVPEPATSSLVLAVIVLLNMRRQGV